MTYNKDTGVYSVNDQLILNVKKITNKQLDQLMEELLNNKINVVLFIDVESLDQADKINLYGSIYIYALIIPLVSILGVIFANYLRNKKIQNLRSQGLEFNDERGNEKTKVNWWI